MHGTKQWVMVVQSSYYSTNEINAFKISASNPRYAFQISYLLEALHLLVILLVLVFLALFLSELSWNKIARVIKHVDCWHSIVHGLGNERQFVWRNTEQARNCTITQHRQQSYKDGIR